MVTESSHFRLNYFLEKKEEENKERYELKIDGKIINENNEWKKYGKMKRKEV